VLIVINDVKYVQYSNHIVINGVCDCLGWGWHYCGRRSWFSNCWQACRSV